MKSYKEIAANVLKRRDEYLARQKRKKRMVKASVASVAGCCIVLTACYGLWESGAFDGRIPIANPQDDVTTTTTTGATHGTTTSAVSSQTTATTRPTTTQSTTSPSISAYTTSTSSTVPTTTVEPPRSSETTDVTETTTTAPIPPSTGDRFVIDSIDKVNFYAAKKILDQRFSPFGMSANAAKTPPIARMIYEEYPIDRNRVFIITMATYFTIELHNENGFLAQKLGGIGEVEVVVIQNDLADLGQMITFKRGDVYYTCLSNGGGTEENGIDRCDFSSHKYIDGFNLVKNLEQENYQFTVRYDRTKVIGFECEPFKSTSSEYAADTVTFIEDYCAVIFTKQYFTIDMLETFFGAQNAQERL